MPTWTSLPCKLSQRPRIARLEPVDMDASAAKGASAVLRSSSMFSHRGPSWSAHARARTHADTGTKRHVAKGGTHASCLDSTTRPRIHSPLCQSLLEVVRLAGWQRRSRISDRSTTRAWPWLMADPGCSRLAACAWLPARSGRRRWHRGPNLQPGCAGCLAAWLSARARHSTGEMTSRHRSRNACRPGS